MEESRYTDGRYLAENPTWHTEDSAWKARQILRMLERNRIRPQTLCEVGCGAGDVLAQLQKGLEGSCELHGYEISPQAFQLCQERANEKLHFHLRDFLQEEAPHFDLLMLIDVIEHMDDYLGFLASVKNASQYKLLHIPLDLSVQSVLRPGKLAFIRHKMGHIHYFTRETAVRALEDSGYRVIDHFLTPVALEAANKTLKTHIANVPRRAVAALHKDLAQRLFGGFSLMVLAE
jgi:cyclopropane fatty-acyl-phospholipid synthase-like methyltransferase